METTLRCNERDPPQDILDSGTHPLESRQVIDDRVYKPSFPEFGGSLGAHGSFRWRWEYLWSLYYRARFRTRPWRTWRTSSLTLRSNSGLLVGFFSSHHLAVPAEDFDNDPFPQTLLPAHHTNLGHKSRGAVPHDTTDGKRQSVRADTDGRHQQEQLNPYLLGSEGFKSFRSTRTKERRAAPLFDTRLVPCHLLHPQSSVTREQSGAIRASVPETYS